MGLADLYQLRGRAGRGNLRGYAFCIIPGESLMSDEAKKRLQALQEMSYLGAGFRLALRTLRSAVPGTSSDLSSQGISMRSGLTCTSRCLKRPLPRCGERRLPKRSSRSSI